MRHYYFTVYANDETVWIDACLGYDHNRLDREWSFIEDTHSFEFDEFTLHIEDYHGDMKHDTLSKIARYIATSDKLWHRLATSHDESQPQHAELDDYYSSTDYQYPTNQNRLPFD